MGQKRFTLVKRTRKREQKIPLNDLNKPHRTARFPSPIIKPNNSTRSRTLPCVNHAGESVNFTYRLALHPRPYLAVFR
jgi:hypothetical protein